MQQISWQENPGARNFDMAAKFLDYMKDQQTAINAESTTRVPQLLNAIESDLLILQPLATSPAEVSMFNGIQASLNMFKAFAMNSGKWTWNSDLDLGTTHNPPPPPSPGSATYACSDSPDVSTCSQAAAPSDISTNQSPQPTTSSTQSATPSLSNPQGTSCPPDQVMSCAQVGMGDHAFSSCACFAAQESTSEMSTTQPPTAPGPEPEPGPTGTSPLSTGADHDLYKRWDGRARVFNVWLRDDSANHEHCRRDYMGHRRRLSVGPHKHMHSEWLRAACVLVLCLCRSDRASLPTGAAAAAAAVTGTSSAITLPAAAAGARIRDDVGACFRNHVCGYARYSCVLHPLSQGRDLG